MVFAIACALGGATLALVIRVLLGDWPSPVIYASMVVIGIGAALVAFRYGRLGPFAGELGPPTLEADVRERIQRETLRAARSGRDFTVLAVRQESGSAIAWGAIVRGVDQVIRCRHGLVLVLLPETSPDGALMLLRRVTSTAAVDVYGALVNSPRDGVTGPVVCQELARLLRESNRPGTVLVRGSGVVEALSIAA
jgi:hypothetical protein